MGRRWGDKGRRGVIIRLRRVFKTKFVDCRLMFFLFNLSLTASLLRILSRSSKKLIAVQW